MAHDCPDCYTQCHCGGDIDDINFGEDPTCTHYRKIECDGHREYCANPACPCHAHDEYDEEEDVSQEDL